MADIKLNKDKAQRITARILRDDAKMLPEQANTLASKICTNIQLAMARPTKPGLRGYRMIHMRPPFDLQADFTADLVERFVDVDDRVAMAVWEMVYEYGEDLPDDVVV